MTTTHHAILASFWMILGACAGSFLNVCIHRIPRGLSVLRPRSRCPGCGVAILACDNIPVMGWLLLGGRCRGCRGPIPVRYPAVELAVGVLFALPYLAIAAATPGDPWERIGIAGLLSTLVVAWLGCFLGMYVVLVGGFGRSRLSGRREGAGCEALTSSARPMSTNCD